MTDPTAKPAKCAICGKPSVPKYRPFCSKRCADVDLHRWLGGAYRVPSDDEGPDDQDANEGHE